MAFKRTGTPEPMVTPEEHKCLTCNFQFRLWRRPNERRASKNTCPNCGGAVITLKATGKRD